VVHLKASAHGVEARVGQLAVHRADEGVAVAEDLVQVD